MKKSLATFGGFFAVLFLLCGVWPGLHFSEAEAADGDYSFSESLYAASAVLMDAQTGRVLYGKDCDVPMAMASTTKIMTCILVLELGDPEDIVTVSSYAASMPKVHLGMKRGEEYRVEDLLYSLMLDSHNDSAVALAEYIGKRDLEPELAAKSSAEYSPEESRRAVAAFAARMNEKARELGCEKTYFITPNGLDATETITTKSGETIVREHCTTARELAAVMAYCILNSPRKEEFLKITRAGSYSFTANKRSYAGVNHNLLLQMMDGALSGKTGFTNKAGYCYVGAYQKDGKTFTLALLACGWPNNRSYKWSDAKALFGYGMDTYSYKSFDESDVAYPKERLSPIPVDNGQTAVLGRRACVEVGVETTDSSFDGLLLRPDEKVSVSCKLEKLLDAPVSSGACVGEITYSVDGAVYRRDRIVTKRGVGRIDFWWCAGQIADRFLIK